MPPAKLHLDMETGDPDDVVTLALVATHAAFDLRSVSVCPGTRKQVGLVRRVLRSVGRSDVPVGSDRPDHPKECVAPWYAELVGDFTEEAPDVGATELMACTASAHPGATLLTGAALTNPASLLARHTPMFARWVGQGGFAGDNLVAPEHRLEKFAGLSTCPTFNFNGDKKAAFAMTESPKIGEKLLVGKNVCHGFVWREPYRSSVLASALHPGLRALLDRIREGKALHDVLAAVAVTAPELITFARAQPYRERGEWGSKATDDPTAPLVAVAYDETAVWRWLGS